MSSEVLYRKWRPQTLTEVVGQEAVTTTLRNAVRTDRVGHAYLFCGPRGTGKTSTGRILAKAVNCLNPRDGEPCNACEACLSISEGRCLDVIEIDAASNRSVEDTRMLRERVHYASGTVRRKVYIIDEVHMLTDAASNTLLKTLEEPPPHVMFILATTEFHKVLPTIVSRCQSFHFRRLTLNAIAAKLKVVCLREGIEAGDDVLVAISRAAGGSLRDAENILQQLIASRGSTLLLDDVREALGIGDEAFVVRFLSALVARDLPGGMRVLHEMSDEGVDIRNFGRQVVSTLRDVLLVQSGCDDIVEGGAERLQELRIVAQGATTQHVARAARRFSEVSGRDAAQPLLALELAYVDCVVGDVTEPVKGPGAHESPAHKRETHAPTRTPASDRSDTRARAPARTAPQPDPSAAVASPLAAPATNAGPDDVPQQSEERPPVPGEAAVAAVPETGGTMRADGEALAPASPEPLASAEPEGDLSHVRSTWKEYVDSLRGLGSTGNLDAFLRSACEPVALNDDTLVLRFAYSFHKNKIEDPKYLHVVEERLQDFYGRPFRVSCILEEDESAPAEPQRPVESSERTPERLVDAAIRMGARLRNQG